MTINQKFIDFLKMKYGTKDLYLIYVFI